MTSAISSPSKQLFKSIKENLEDCKDPFNNTKKTLIKDTPPTWAKGNFSGVWGLDVWGENNTPLGWMVGYYKLSINIGYFAAGFNFFGEPAILWVMQGYFFGIFMFGNMGKNEYTNQTFFVGICKYNNSEYKWRIVGEEGPLFFMSGKYTPFN